MNRPAYTPENVDIRSDLEETKICRKCGAGKDPQHDFEHGKKTCKSCCELEELRKANKNVENILNYPSKLLTGSSAQNLDSFLSFMTEEFGGDKAFAKMLAEQICHAFEKYPGRASNLTFGYSFMKLLAVRDQGEVNRALAEISHEELKVKKKTLLKELAMDLFSEDQRISFANQLLRSTGQSVEEIAVSEYQQQSDCLEAGPAGESHSGAG